MIKMLDCTLRDGAYVVDSKFGAPAIRGIIRKMQDANIDLIECGWLKDKPHMNGTSYFHVPSDLEHYLSEKRKNSMYVVMIDWDRYNLNNLPVCDGKSVDAIRIVFPQNKFKEAIALGKIVKNKKYKVFFQAANTLGYSDKELIDLAEEINVAMPEGLSIVDTYGAMYPEDLSRIISILDNNLDKKIQLGFHSHNNQQLSFALSQQFINTLANSERDIVVDSSLCGMGRGAGNTTTELLASFLNKKYNGNYDMNVILDAIDTYMGYFQENYSWGYSTPYFISGLYCAHVNNIAYLQKNHRTNAKDMHNIISSLTPKERRNYDYDLLESRYLDYPNKVVDDSSILDTLEKQLSEKKVLLISPGNTIKEQKDKIDQYIKDNSPIIIGVNAISDLYKYDYIFFCNRIRYDYAKEVYTTMFDTYRKIVVSNIKTVGDEKEDIINFNLLVKRGWEHFDNATIMCLRLLNKVHVSDVALAGFDGFSEDISKNYYDISLPAINPGKTWELLNNEIKDMFQDFINTTSGKISIKFITDSIFN